MRPSPARPHPVEEPLDADRLRLGGELLVGLGEPLDRRVRSRQSAGRQEQRDDRGGEHDRGADEHRGDRGIHVAGRRELPACAGERERLLTEPV